MEGARAAGACDGEVSHSMAETTAPPLPVAEALGAVSDAWLARVELGVGVRGAAAAAEGAGAVGAGWSAPAGGAVLVSDVGDGLARLERGAGVGGAAAVDGAVAVDGAAAAVEGAGAAGACDGEASHSMAESSTPPLPVAEALGAVRDTLTPSKDSANVGALVDLLVVTCFSYGTDEPTLRRLGDFANR